MSPFLFKFIEVAAPFAVDIFQAIRMKHPEYATLTDVQMFETLRADAAALRTKAEAWLAGHPETPGA